jgi:hypothetical protein
MRNGFDLFSLGNFLLECEWHSDRRPSEATVGGQNFGSCVGQYGRSSEPRPEMSALPQRLQNTPRPFIYMPVGLGLVILFFRRAGSLGKRIVILAAGSLVSGCLAVFVAGGTSAGTARDSQERVNIRRHGAHLFAQSAGQTEWVNAFPPDSFELLPQSGGSFFERLSGMTVTFSRDKANKVTGFTALSGVATLSYKKISDQPPEAPKPREPRVAIKLDARLLDACVGRYAFPSNSVFPAGVIATIWREGDRLAGSVGGSNTMRGVFDIYPESHTNFFLTLDGAQLLFIKNARGEVTGVIRRKNGQPDLEGKKLPVPDE